MFKKYKNIGIFRISPENEYTNYSKSHLKKGKDYHNRFEYFIGRKILFDLEKKIVLKESTGYESHLDFACGTGRWLSIINIKDTYGLDISESMLNVAKENNKGATLYNFNFREVDKLNGKSFELITAFRFFPNADPLLREDAIKYLSSKLKREGKLIFNNHRNFWSLPYVFFRFLFLGFWQAGMSHNQVIKLIENAQLKIITTYSLGIMPQGEVRAILPWFIIKFIENINARFLSKFHRIGYNMIYICKKIK